MTIRDVGEAIEELLRQWGSFSSGELSARTGLTRQALRAHLVRAVADGRIVRTGRGRGTRYERAAGEVFSSDLAVAGLREDVVWLEVNEWLDSVAPDMTPTATEVSRYVFTEILNNAVDHSGSERAGVRVQVHAGRIRMRIADEGIGAFENVRQELGLASTLHALQELSKGKVTTCPEAHTGEGLFFSSKMVDRFELRANGLVWIVDNVRDDQAIAQGDDEAGTRVETELALDSTTEPSAVFARYTTDVEFDKTRCVVRLFEHGVSFVSRPEAKRLLEGLDRFREVIVDFRGVEGVGQGFVDEVFRVWRNAHPETRLHAEGMNPAVEFMVRRGWKQP